MFDNQKRDQEIAIPRVMLAIHPGGDRRGSAWEGNGGIQSPMDCLHIVQVSKNQQEKSMIDLIQDEGGDYIVENEDKALIGYVYRDPYGQFVFEAPKRRPGPFSPSTLYEIADNLKQMNDEKQPSESTIDEQAWSRYFEWIVKAQKNIEAEVEIAEAEKIAAIAQVEYAVDSVNKICARCSDSPFHEEPTLRILNWASKSNCPNKSAKLFVSIDMDNKTPLTGETIRRELEFEINRRLLAVDLNHIDILIQLNVSQ